MRGAWRPIHEERLVRREGPVAAQPDQGLVHHILGQVIFWIMRRFDRIGVLEQPRLVLRGFPGEKTIEIVEAISRRPAVERPHRRGLGRRRIVPFAEGGGLVAIFVQHLGYGRRGLRYDAGVAVEVERPLGDGAGPDVMMVAPGEKRRARRRADRGRVKRVVADPLIGETGQRRRRDLAAEGVGQAEADVVQKNDEDIGRVRREAVRLDAPDMLRTPARSDRRRSPKGSGERAGPSRRTASCPQPRAPAPRQRRRADRSHAYKRRESQSHAQKPLHCVPSPAD